jgi:hypothetical protein
MKKENWALGLSIGAIAISIIALVRFWARTENTGIDYLGILIGILTLIIAILAILFGFNMFGLKKEMKDYINEKIKKQNKSIDDKIQKQDIKINDKIESKEKKISSKIAEVQTDVDLSNFQREYNAKNYGMCLFYAIECLYYTFKSNKVDVIKSYTVFVKFILRDITTNYTHKIKIEHLYIELIIERIKEMKEKGVDGLDDIEEKINQNTEVIDTI